MSQRARILTVIALAALPLIALVGARIGAFTFLSKPFELAALVAGVDAALGAI